MVRTVRPLRQHPGSQRKAIAHFSNSAKSRVSNVSSQPTSTRILIPPSSSRIDCDAFEEEDCAPSNGVKVNILAVSASLLRLGFQRDGVESVAQLLQSEIQVFNKPRVPIGISTSYKSHQTSLLYVDRYIWRGGKRPGRAEETRFNSDASWRSTRSCVCRVCIDRALRKQTKPELCKL